MSYLAHHSGRCFEPNCYGEADGVASELRRDGWRAVSGPTQCRTHPGRWIVFAPERAWDQTFLELPSKDPRRQSSR